MPAVGGRPLPAQPGLRQRHRRRQAADAELAVDGRGGRCTARRGVGIWEWAGNDDGTATRTWCSAAPATCRRWRRSPRPQLLRRHLPDLKVRVVNVVDLMRLQDETEHPHGLSDREFDTLFTDGQAGRVRLPRLPVADPPPDLPAHQPRQPPRARLQGGGHDDHAVRHGDAQRPRPLPPRHGRHRPGARARVPRRERCASRWSTSGCATAPTPASTARTPRTIRDWQWADGAVTG